MQSSSATAPNLHVLTLLNTSNPRLPKLAEFAGWLEETGATPVTVHNYTRAVERWSDVLIENPGVRPGKLWQNWAAPKSMKRLVGYACRRWVEFFGAVLGETVDMGVPSRLPAASRPEPRPVTDAEFRRLHLTAKRILPSATAVSFRVWLHLLEQTGVRRTESDIDWAAIDWEKNSVVVRGKTGERELPLGSCGRLLAWLKGKNPEFPWLGFRGQRLRGAALYNLFKRVARHAGLASLRPHLLRHRRLTALCRSHLGSNPLLVLSFAGSAHVSSLAPYYSVSLQEKTELLKASRCL
jgi:site-specific recombinase XerD